jgi:hypothetical protein
MAFPGILTFRRSVKFFLAVPRASCYGKDGKRAGFATGGWEKQGKVEDHQEFK